MDNQKYLRNKSEGLEDINFRPLLVCLMCKKVNIYLFLVWSERYPPMRLLTEAAKRFNINLCFIFSHAFS